MDEILKIIVEYASIWAPSLVSMIGVATTVILAINKTYNAISDFKADKTLADVNSKLTKLANENEELVRCNKLLLDELTKIKNFADTKK